VPSHLLIAQIIVKYDADDIYLHGARNLKTLKEEDPIVYAKKYNWKLVPFKGTSMYRVLMLARH
jgi:hypothetical protein